MTTDYSMIQLNKCSSNKKAVASFQPMRTTTGHGTFHHQLGLCGVPVLKSVTVFWEPVLLDTN